jgi:hypothetical protein
MATCDTRGHDDDNPFAIRAHRGQHRIFDVSAARQSNPRRRHSTTHTGFSGAGLAPVTGGTTQR